MVPPPGTVGFYHFLFMLEVNVKPTTQTGFNLKLGYNDVIIVTLI